ncbi:MAG: tRNA (adenosine(37)-N6)-dimethylallyltransferase MiaA [Elusimicrobia bacterium]|nr:tRNA (adenosine(37)-N6)-dimethylallyltransferase MiaA [Elusimicrobiota bacterium]
MARELEPLLVAGPTASGKTELAVALAQDLGGEIISADSRQVYRFLGAGTAKPARDAEGRVQGIPLHLIDFVDPAEVYDVGRFVRDARRLCAEIQARGHVPILAGGTGLFLRAYLNGLSPMPKADPDLRRRLAERCEREGLDWLHQRLSREDPEAARSIPRNNRHRMIRAIEVLELSGRPISSFWAQGRAGASPALVLVLDWQNTTLAQRIKERARGMWPKMLEEVRRLVPSRFSGQEPGFLSHGYREAVACAAGRLTDEKGLGEMIRQTAAYAKRQRTWLRHQIPVHARIAGGTLQSMREQALAAVKERRFS